VNDAAAELPPPEGWEKVSHVSAFADLIGPSYQRREGEITLRAFRVQPKHANRMGLAHGGMLMSFADNVLSRAGVMASREEQELDQGASVTLRMTCDFVAPAAIGDWVEGRAWVERLSASTIFLAGKLTVGKRVVMTMTGLWARVRPRPLVPPVS